MNRIAKIFFSRKTEPRKTKPWIIAILAALDYGSPCSCYGKANRNLEGLVDFVEL